MTTRLESKAIELGINRATIFRWRKRWTKCRDITAFVNSKRLEPRVTRIARLDRRLLQAIFDEMDTTVDASSATKDAFRKAVSYRCKQAHGSDIFTRPGGIKEPPESTYNRVLSDVGHPRGFFNGTSEARRGIALRPKRAYQPRQAEWPGELVLFDSSAFDAILYDPVSQTFCKFDVHIAFDLATRSIVGRRFEPAGNSGRRCRFSASGRDAPEADAT